MSLLELRYVYASVFRLLSDKSLFVTLAFQANILYCLMVRALKGAAQKTECNIQLENFKMSDKTISRRGFVSGALAVISAGSFLWLSPASSGYKRQEDIKMRKKVIIESTLKPGQQQKVLPFLEKIYQM